MKKAMVLIAALCAAQSWASPITDSYLRRLFYPSTPVLKVHNGTLVASVSTTFTTFAVVNRAGQLSGTHSWGTASNAQTSNDVRAIWSKAGGGAVPYGGTTAYLQATQLTATVPANAVIDGIKATIERRINDSTASTAVDSVVYVVQGGTIQTTQNKASGTGYTTSDVAATYGGAADLWGLSWTAADVNGSGFGIAISCQVSVDFESPGFPEIDAITIEVFYTPGSSVPLLPLIGIG